MNAFEAALAEISRSFGELGRPWALVGALAVAARAEARATLDVDIVVAVESHEEATRVVEALRSRGYRWQRNFGHSMTSFLVPDGPEAGLRLDVIFSLSGIEEEVARRAEQLEVLPGIELPVAQLGDLMALKILAAGEPGREHDWRDLRALLARSEAQDLELARSGFALIAARGRGSAQELGERLQRLIEEP